MDSLNRRDVGIAGALVILAQAITSSQSTSSINDQLEELRKSILMAKIEREQYFVRKEELRLVVQKIDKITEKLSVVEARLVDNYSLEECDPLIEDLSCNEVASRD